MRGESSAEPQPIDIGIDLPSPGDAHEPADWDAKSSQYVADARRESACLRWEALATEMPKMVETDWNRPVFERNADAISAVRNWSHNSKGLLLTGPTGRGKTRAILDLLRRLAVDEGHDFRYWHASTWFSELQKQNRFGRDEAHSWVSATAIHGTVVIDDLGQEAIGTVKGEDWAQSWLFRFLDVRLAHGLPLIVTTNLSASSIAGTAQRAEIRADPLIRRLLDLCEVIKFI